MSNTIEGMYSHLNISSLVLSEFWRSREEIEGCFTLHDHGVYLLSARDVPDGGLFQLTEFLEPWDGRMQKLGWFHSPAAAQVYVEALEFKETHARTNS